MAKECRLESVLRVDQMCLMCGKSCLQESLGRNTGGGKKNCCVSVDLKMHNVRVVSFSFIQRIYESYSLGNSLSIGLRELLWGSRGEALL